MLEDRRKNAPTQRLSAGWRMKLLLYYQRHPPTGGETLIGKKRQKIPEKYILLFFRSFLEYFPLFNAFCSILCCKGQIFQHKIIDNAKANYLFK
jgi:hypothetical protein